MFYFKVKADTSDNNYEEYGLWKNIVICLNAIIVS